MEAQGFAPQRLNNVAGDCRTGCQLLYAAHGLPAASAAGRYTKADT
jgi:hypothetical protein